jgi:repressor LexA
MANSPLTKRQKEVLDRLQQFQQEQGYNPSYRELMALCGLSSVASVARHMKTLQAKGVLTHTPKAWRSAEIKKRAQANGTIEAPCIGAISKERRLELFAQPEAIALPSSLLSGTGPFYAFRIEDNSFFAHGIVQNDIIVLATQRIPQNGDLVMALEAQQKVRLGRFFQDKEGIYIDTVLIRSRAVSIHGIIISLMRTY